MRELDRLKKELAWKASLQEGFLLALESAKICLELAEDEQRYKLAKEIRDTIVVWERKLIEFVENVKI